MATAIKAIPTLKGKEAREFLRRAMTGQLNEKEKAARQRLKDSEKYWSMEWKGLHF